MAVTVYIFYINSKLKYITMIKFLLNFLGLFPLNFNGDLVRLYYYAPLFCASTM